MWRICKTLILSGWARGGGCSRCPKASSSLDILRPHRHRAQTGRSREQKVPSTRNLDTMHSLSLAKLNLMSDMVTWGKSLKNEEQMQSLCLQTALSKCLSRQNQTQKLWLNQLRVIFLSSHSPATWVSDVFCIIPSLECAFHWLKVTGILVMWL